MNVAYPELKRGGFSKDELKPLGVWIHDGTWQNYNQHWSCCLAVDKKSPYCKALGYSGEEADYSASYRYSQ